MHTISNKVAPLTLSSESFHGERERERMKCKVEVLSHCMDFFYIYIALLYLVFFSVFMFFFFKNKKISYDFNGKREKRDIKKVQKDIFILNFNIDELRKLDRGNLK